jgi:hypothetical protein
MAGAGIVGAFSPGCKTRDASGEKAEGSVEAWCADPAGAGGAVTALGGASAIFGRGSWGGRRTRGSLRGLIINSVGPIATRYGRLLILYLGVGVGVCRALTGGLGGDPTGPASERLTKAADIKAKAAIHKDGQRHRPAKRVVGKRRKEVDQRESIAFSFGRMVAFLSGDLEKCSATIF